MFSNQAPIRNHKCKHLTRQGKKKSAQQLQAQRTVEIAGPLFLYKNKVISLSSTVFFPGECGWRGVCRVPRYQVMRRGWAGEGELGRGRGSGRLSASCRNGQPSSVDVEVSEVVEGGAQGPAGLHVIHLLGQLSIRQTDRG